MLSECRLRICGAFVFLWTKIGYATVLFRLHDRNVFFPFLAEVAIVDVVFGLFGDHARKREYQDDVRNGHERISDIRNRPDHVADADGSKEPDDDVDDLIGDNRLSAKQVRGAAVAIIAPPENRRIGKAHHAEDENGRSHEGDGGKCGVRQIGPLLQRAGGGDLGVGEHGGHEHEAGHEADHHSRPERAGRGNERLTCGVLGRGGCCDDRRGSEARLVREQPACAPVLEGDHDTASDGSSEGGLCSERAFEDLHQCSAEVLVVDHEDDDAAERIGNRHEGHEFLANVGDGLDAAKDNDGNEDRDYDGEHPLGNDGEIAADDARHRRGLDGGAGSQSCDYGEQGEQHRAGFCPFGGRAVGAFEGAFPSVHGAADHLALVVFHTVANRGVDLGVLRSDAEHAGEPHPEDGTGSARDDRGGNADDRAGADRAGERGHERAELRDIALGVIVILYRHLDCRRQLALDEPESDGEENVRSQKQANHYRAPDERIHLV